jgi:hypothetical protein
MALLRKCCEHGIYFLIGTSLSPDDVLETNRTIRRFIKKSHPFIDTGMLICMGNKYAPFHYQFSESTNLMLENNPLNVTASPPGTSIP